ncbi:MAG: type II secretion system F family protein [bacterium]|nr:type II secretion system F family protein [bacterium]
MPKRFQYKAKNSRNETIGGSIEADSESRAADQLLQRELIVISLKEIKGAGGGLAFFKRFSERVSKKDLAIFLRQLSILISAAVPLVQALRILSEQATNPGLKAALVDVVTDVEGGTKLSNALERYEHIFNDYFINMVKSGETSGRLDEILNYLADQQEKDYELQSKINGAMAYPIFIIGIMTVAAIVMMTFVLPKMLAMFTELGPDVVLPLTTRMLIATSSFSQKFWWLIVIGLVGGMFAFRTYVKTPAGKRVYDFIKLKIPIFGDLLRYVYLVRFSRSLNTILIGGVTIPVGLKIVKNVVGNAVFEDLIAETLKEVEDGNPISTVFMKSKEIPSMVSQMLSVGEQTGRLDDVLDKITQFYVREVNAMIETTIKLIEPAIMVVLGLGVGVMVSGILLPMYTLTSKL